MMTKEDLLKIFLEEPPVDKSPYGLYGHPPMWKLFENSADNLVLYGRLAKTLKKIDFEYIEVDGVSIQWKKNNQWAGQAATFVFDDFLIKFNNLIENYECENTISKYKNM